MKELYKYTLICEKAGSFTLDSETIRNSNDVYNLAVALKYDKFAEEHFGMLLLNTKGVCIGYMEVSHGDLCSSVVHPREIYKRAIMGNASSLILLHNHPSGDPTPSDTDRETTKRIIEAGNILGVPVLDHLVICDGGFKSVIND